MSKISFLQLENESAAAYQKFEIYRDMGRRRSLRRAYRYYMDQKEGATKGGEKQQKALESQGDKPGNVSGQWVRLSKKHQWWRRIGAYELDRFLKAQEQKRATNSTQFNT